MEGGERSVYVLLRDLTSWMKPTLIMEGNVLYSVYQFKCQSYPKNALSTETPSIMFDQILRHPGPVGLTQKINHHRDQLDRELNVRKMKDWMALWLIAWSKGQVLLTKVGFLKRGANLGEKKFFIIPEIFIDHQACIKY